ncbi:Calcineurin-like phosphoesterase [Paraburkholderia fungorum]|uniref:Calcineurin-like phosphoesterase n=1 Tax=Paraburkholderia fungorum TaxID=134537 RepID=A0A1H1JNP1_9BURK|nr:metallophosphoesterase [Paraburkholderia fungorum]SDR51285.1 Calcineurin-like phosphoesterase [Paraburkholderia fungorum]
MRIQIASDLHLEMLQRSFPDYNPVGPSDADVLVLAGDIANGGDAVDLFAHWPVPVIYVHGNHEAYGMEYGTLARMLGARAAGTAVRYLERDTLVIDDVRFLGCCLWTDYALLGDRERSMKMAGRHMYDHTVIRKGCDGWFLPAHALAEHEASIHWLQKQLATPFDGKTIVVTHHGVAPSSVHPRYGNDPVNAAFVSDLRPLLESADLWIHGHVHDSFDYRVGRARVIANPRGYARNRMMAGAPGDLKWENPTFDPALVIDV